MMETEFGPVSMQAFRRLALDGATGVEAAGEVGTLTSLTPGWIHYSVTITDPDSAVLPPG